MSYRIIAGWLLFILAFWTLLSVATRPSARLDALNPDDFAETDYRLIPAIGLLTQLLTKYDDEERERAALALGMIGQPTVPVLRKLLTHEDELTRQVVVKALGFVGRPAKPIAPTLVKMLRNDPDDDVCVEAVHSLAKIMVQDSGTLHEFETVLHDRKTSPQVRDAIFRELPKWGEAAIPVLGRALSLERHRAVRLIVVLLDIHPTPATVERVRPFVAEIYEMDQGFNAWSAERHHPAISKPMSRILTILGMSAIKPLDPVLQGNDVKEQRKAVLALARMALTLIEHGNSPKLVDQIVMRLVPFCQHPDPGLRKLAVANIPHTKSSEPVIRQALIDEEDDIRRAVRNTFGLMPLHAKETELTKLLRAVDTKSYAELKKYLTHHDAALRARAAFAIAEDSSWYPVDKSGVKKEVVSILVENLKSDDIRKCRKAVHGLALLQALEPAEVPLLLGMLKKEDPDLRSSAIYALRSQNSDQRNDIRAAVTPYLKDRKSSVRFAAVSCLSRSPKGSFSNLVEAYRSEKDLWNVKDAVLKFLTEQNDARALETLLDFMVQNGDYSAESALLRMDEKKAFPRVLDVWCQQDTKICITIEELPKRPATREEAAFALADRFKRDDPLNHDRVAYTARRMLHYFQNAPEPAWVAPMEQGIAQSLDRIGLRLHSKDAEERLNMIFTVWYIRELQRQIDGLHRRASPNDAIIRDLLKLGCADPVLANRRVARKALHSNHTPVWYDHR